MPTCIQCQQLLTKFTGTSVYVCKNPECSKYLSPIQIPGHILEQIEHPHAAVVLLQEALSPFMMALEIPLPVLVTKDFERAKVLSLEAQEHLKEAGIDEK